MTNTSLTLVDIDGEPRIHDLEIAARLGFPRPRDIRKLIQRNVEKLKEFSRCATVSRRPENGGTPYIEFYLDQKQAIFICMKSETNKAFEVQADIVRVYDAHLKGEQTHLPKDPTLAMIVQLALETDSLKSKLSNLTHATETIRDVTKKVAENLNHRLTKLESLAVTGVTDPAPITRGNPKRPFLYRKGMMTRTEVGKHFGLSAQRVSDILIELGLQIDVTPKWVKRRVYELTPLGRAYGAPIHTNGALIAKGSTATGAQRARTILWLPEVLSVIAEHIEAEA